MNGHWRWQGRGWSVSPKKHLYIHAGDICRSLGCYEDAFAYWRKALEPDSSFLDAMYYMGFCYEELGQYRKAHDVWRELVRILDHRGLVIEKEYPARMAENCLKWISG